MPLMKQTPSWEDESPTSSKEQVVRVCPDPCGRTYETTRYNPQPICQWCMKGLREDFWREYENGQEEADAENDDAGIVPLGPESDS